MPGPTAKLLAVWHATYHEIAIHFGADAAQFLLIEGGSCALLLLITVLSMLVMFPVNLYAGRAMISDQFSKTTINHVEKGSSLLWVHFVFVVVVLVHFGVCAIEESLRVTRFRDGFGNASGSSTAFFTVMIEGVPKILGANKTPLEEYFQRKYPGKVYRVIVPMDVCTLNDLAADLVKVRDDISWLVARMDSRLLLDDDVGYEYRDEYGRDLHEGVWGRMVLIWKNVKKMWDALVIRFGFTDEDRLRKLQEFRADLETDLAAYKDGLAPGAGVAFVMFKDVYTANKAVQDFRNEIKS